MRKNKLVPFIVLALGIISLVLVLFVTRRSQNTENKSTQTHLENYMRKHDINGVILVTGKDNKTVVLKNRETKNENQIVRSDQLFPTASLQKILTGSAIYKLKQEKKLDWNTRLSKYFPQISGSQDITIGQLMNHTSGLINNARPSEPLKDQNEQVDFMLKHMKNDHLHNWDYQDVDYELLAAIISKEAKVSYNDYIKNDFTKNLHLNKIKDFSEVAKSEVVQPLDENASWHEVTVTTSSDFGAGNLFMSPNDYWKFVYNKVLKDPQMIKEFARQAKDQEVPYFGGVYFKGNIIRAEGSIPGYNCCFVANYKTKQMIMLFSNNINYMKLKLASDYILRDYFE